MGPVNPKNLSLHNPFSQPFYTTCRRQAAITLGAKPRQPSPLNPLNLLNPLNPGRSAALFPLHPTPKECYNTLYLYFSVVIC